MVLLARRAIEGGCSSIDSKSVLECIVRVFCFYSVTLVFF